MNQSESTIHLENIRVEQGDEVCIDEFRKAAKRSRAEAVKLLNDNSMTFPCLFLLMPSIEEFRLQQQMYTKYAIAVEVSKQILNENYNPRKDYLKNGGEKAHETLIWMLTTGYQENKPAEKFQKIIDIVVSVLIHIYHETGILPQVAELIFTRRIRGENVHELIWAYFRSRETKSLQFIAEKLPSSDLAEADFIYDLLGISHDTKLAPAEEYEKYIVWLQENENKLVFNEENKQYTSRPVVCRMDQIEGKENAT
ncbi:hypothetical protein [Scatolibacter rhodanostii]|uniref:hypothetical protein n=1 Tax=Scatolibacter rhodanostii TaxID=2014781 RepID=UPI000C07FBAE|nr:hypothetical protein [Scatolibacter rhodanostii]